MPKLILKLDERELQDCAIGAHPVSIGRHRDNNIVIDHPAVSGRHARVYREGTYCVLEDLKSTNGTFVNDKPIARHTLLEGDVILVGKHTLSFTQAGGEDLATPEPIEPQTPPLYDAVVPKTAIRTAHGRIGILKVVDGTTTQSEFVLSAMTTMIGKTEQAQIPLRGWFKPRAAAAISRSNEGFEIAPLEATVTVNGEPIAGSRELASGDLIEVSGLTLEFTLSD